VTLLHRSHIAENLTVTVLPSRDAMGAAAARLVHADVERIARHRRCRLIFGCAPSQDEFFAELVRLAARSAEAWRHTEIFHMDEYIGLGADHPQSFRRYLREHFIRHVEVGEFHPIRGECLEPETEARRYGALLQRCPIDVVCLGFGENGHIAFNDPHVADFADRARVKIVDIDPVCRQQQVNDGCFRRIDEVPTLAATITLPVFSEAGLLCGVVPTRRKAQAVRDALTGPITTACPASLLRIHPRAELFLDRDAACLLPELPGATADPARS
jgi:glucosamine-6-phosphate deaminase